MCLCQRRLWVETQKPWAGPGSHGVFLMMICTSNTLQALVHEVVKMEQREAERSLREFWHRNHFGHDQRVRVREHRRWIRKVRHNPRGALPLKMSRRRNISWALEDLLQEPNLDITFIHKTFNHNASEMQTVMAGREADPHNIWSCLTEIRSLCRPHFKIWRETLSYEDLILFSASESSSEAVNFSQGD